MNIINSYKKQQALYFSLAFICLIVISYPASPVLFEALIIGNNVSYFSYMVVGMILVVSISNRLVKKTTLYTFKKYPLFYLVSLLIFTLIISFVFTLKQFFLRELLTLLFVILIFIYSNRFDFLRLYRLIVYILALILFASEIASIIYLFAPDTFKIWNVSNLNLISNNPILSRDNSGDFKYALYLYLSVIPYEPQSLVIRLPLIFTEPSYCAAYCFGPLLSVTVDEKFKYKLYVSLVLVIAILLSRSTILFLFLFLGLFIALLANSNFARITTFISAFFVLISSSFSLIIEKILKFLPYDKLSEYNTYKNGGAFFLESTKFTLWGSELNSKIFLSYGIETFAVTHGVIVFLVYGLILAAILFNSLNLLNYNKVKFIDRLIPFLSIFVSTLFALKVTSMFIILPLFVFFYFKMLKIDAKIIKTDYV